MALKLFRRTCCFILVYIHSISWQNEIAFCSFTAIQYKKFKKESDTRFTAVWNTKCEVIAIQEIFKAFILSFSFGTVPPKKAEQHREMMLSRTKIKNSSDGERDLCLAGSSGGGKKNKPKKTPTLIAAQKTSKCPLWLEGLSQFQGI